MIVLSVIGFWYDPGHSLFIYSTWIFLIGFLVFGPQMLIGIAAAELAHKEAAGTSTGFVGLFAYIGAAMAGFPLGFITQHFGWHGYFLTVLICAVGATFLLIPLWPAYERPKIKGVDY